MRYHEHYCVKKLYLVLRPVSIVRVQYQIQELESCIACQTLVTGNSSSFFRVVLCFTNFEIGDHLVDRQVAKNINVEEFVRLEESTVLGEVSRQTSKTLAIAEFNSSEGHIKKIDRAVNYLSCLRLSIFLESNERFQVWDLRHIDVVVYFSNSDCSFSFISRGPHLQKPRR